MFIPMVLLLLLGTVLIVIEIFIPGFGAFGLTGIASLIAGFWLMQPTLAEFTVTALIIAAVMVAAFFIAAHSASKGRLSKSGFILNNRSIGDKPVPEFGSGTEGITVTPLHPSGIVAVNGMRIDAVSEGDFIESGKAVKVIRVNGNRVYVQEIKEDEE